MVEEDELKEMDMLEEMEVWETDALLVHTSLLPTGNPDLTCS